MDALARKLLACEVADVAVATRNFHEAALHNNLLQPYSGHICVGGV